MTPPLWVGLWLLWTYNATGVCGSKEYYATSAGGGARAHATPCTFLLRWVFPPEALATRYCAVPNACYRIMCSLSPGAGVCAVDPRNWVISGSCLWPPVARHKVSVRSAGRHRIRPVRRPTVDHPHGGGHPHGAAGRQHKRVRHVDGRRRLGRHRRVPVPGRPRGRLAVSGICSFPKKPPLAHPLAPL
jgi:hypothetical protein